MAKNVLLMKDAFKEISSSKIKKDNQAVVEIAQASVKAGPGKGLGEQIALIINANVFMKMSSKSKDNRARDNKGNKIIKSKFSNHLNNRRNSSKKALRLLKAAAIAEESRLQEQEWL